MLLYRFLATASDPDKDTAEFAKSVLNKTMLTKYPDFFSLHFSEAIIVYNSWSEHPAYQAAHASGSDGGSSLVSLEGVNLNGAARRKHRFALYSFMAAGFTEERKIHVTAKIVDDILSYAIDSNAFSQPVTKQVTRTIVGGTVVETVSVPIEDALEDAFLILRSPLLKVSVDLTSSLSPAQFSVHRISL